MHALLRCVIGLLVLSILITTCISSSTRTRITINEGDEEFFSDDENCTRLANGTLVCLCDVTYNNTYYPCWMEIEDATPPTQPPPTCVDCPPGHYSNISSNVTCGIDCVPGGCSYGVQCPLCNAGYFNPHSKQSACQICLAGSYSNPGASTCTACSPGHHADHSGAKQCIACIPGYFAPGYSSQICNACNAGTFNTDPGSANCTSCQPGSFAGSTGSTSCELCPGGSYSNTPSATICYDCDPGFISPEGATGCTVCPLGMYSNVSNCLPCDSGRYATGPTASCQVCDPGSFSPSNESGVTACISCSVGTANSIPGNDHCPACNAGTYANQSGQKKCSPCPAGSYCPNSGTVSPVNCPPGFYCREGSTNPSQCSTLYHSSTNGAKCIPSPSFYLIIFGSCLAVVIVALIAWRIRVSRHTEARRQNKQLEIDRLIPKPRDNTPTYMGF